MASSDAYNNASLITRDYLCLYTSTTREHTEIPWCAPFLCPESVSKWNFLPFYRTDKFWYMPQTCNTEELLCDRKKNSFPGQLIFDVPSKDCGRISQQYKTNWISHKSFGHTFERRIFRKCDRDLSLKRSPRVTVSRLRDAPTKTAVIMA